MNTNRFVLTVAMILVATASTLLPHPPNFTPLGAIALFSGAFVPDRRAAFLVPLATLLLRDTIIGFHILMPFVYACFAFNICLGLWLRTKSNPWRVAGASLIGSIVFFIVTNFAVWALLGTFPPTFGGLTACYVAGLPYFRNTVSGDLFYAIVMFGTFALAQRRFPTLRATAA